MLASRLLNPEATGFVYAWPGSAGATNVSQGVTMAALHLEFFLDNPKPA
jgi:hypothetical protein